jgi:excisionase family DNA binding protein
MHPCNIISQTYKKVNTNYHNVNQNKRRGKMPKEKNGYRENIAILNEMFPGQNSLGVSEAAAYLGVDRRTVVRLINKKMLPANNVGCGKYNIYRISKLALARL